MVAAHRHGRRSTGRRGCLVSLLLLSVALYYGINIGEVGYRYYRMKEEMQSQARLAPGLSDAVIRRRLLARVEELGLPSQARDIRIARSAETQRITIESRYAESVDLPFFNYTFNLNPRAEAPL